MTETTAHPEAPKWRGVLRETFTIETGVALVLGIALTVWGVHVAAQNPDQRSIVTVMGLGPVLATGLAVLQLAWRGNALLAVQLLLLTFTVSFLGTALCLVAAYITVSLPTTEILYDARGENYALDAPLLMMVGGVGLILSMITAILVFVIVVLPVMAFRRPRQLSEANMLDADPKYAERNERASKAFALTLLSLGLGGVLIFLASRAYAATSVIDSLINISRFAQNPSVYIWDVAWMVGVLLVVLGFVLAGYVAVTQRTNRKLRRQFRVSSLADRAEDDREERNAR